MANPGNARGLPENPSKQVQEQATGLPPAAPASLFRRLDRLRWPILCLFQCGVIFSLLAIWWHGGTAPETQNERSDESLPTPASLGASLKPEASSSALGADDLARAETMLRQARYEEALAIYQGAKGNAESSLAAPARYRAALCLEGLGHWEQSLSAYQSLGGQNADSLTAAAAQLGQARLYLRLQRSPEAKALLWDLLLKTSSPALREQPLVDDVHYLLALALSKDALPSRKGPAEYDELASFQPEDWTIERFLEWLTLPNDAKLPAAAPERLELQRLGRRPEDVLVSVTTRQAALAEFIERLATESNLHTEWSARARQQVASRSVTLAVERLPLSDLMQALVERFGLGWRLEKGTVCLFAEDESAPATLAKSRLLVARRRLREAVLAHPNHPLAAMAYLQLGNIEGADSNWTGALSWYERIVREFPQSPTRLEAHYNLGLIQSKLANVEAAQKAFYWVADQAPGHALASAAYLRIGRVYLENDAVELALRPLRRAFGASAGSAERPIAALTLAAAYLLNNNPRAANATLVEARSQVTQEPYLPMAAFLDSLARYRAVVDRRLGEREASELLAALLLVRENQYLEPVGSLLLGEAYSQLGMMEQMAAVYEKALPGVRGPLAAQMTYALGEYYVTQENRERARQMFKNAVAVGTPKWTPRAQTRLAEMALRDKQLDACLSICEELLINPDPAQKATTLKLMGRAFELRGNHRQAARCFAGLLPEP